VAELIKALQEMPQGMEVLAVFDADGSPCDIFRVAETTMGDAIDCEYFDQDPTRRFVIIT
jgi:TusA-related sulfurtransferase